MSEKSNDRWDYLWKQSWDYFQSHASQRLTTFNYYILISSVITTGMVATFQKDYKMPYAGIILGIVLAFFSFIFWKLDERNKHLIKNAEAALRVFENEIEPDVTDIKDSETTDAIITPPNKTKIFSLEEFESQERKKQNTWSPFKEYSYSRCFGLVFLSFGFIGVAGAIASFISIKYPPAQNSLQSTALVLYVERLMSLIF